MLLKSISAREKKWFYGAVIIIAGVLVYIFVVEPIWMKWKSINEEISSKEMKLIKNMKILAQKDIIGKLYGQYAGNIKMKGSAEEETATILREIENIARASQTRITDIKPQKIKDMEFYKEYYIELEAEGQISNLARFIYELRNSAQMLKVRHLRLNPEGSKSDQLKGYMIVTKILIP